jgi:hypothetical protein
MVVAKGFTSHLLELLLATRKANSLDICGFHCMLDIRQGFGCILAEYKRPAPKEWRETAKRFKAPNRLREARRAADMEPGYARIPAGLE